MFAGVIKVEPETTVVGVDGAEPEPPMPAEYEMLRIRLVVAATREDSWPLNVEESLPIDVAVTQNCVLAASPVNA